MKGIEVMEIEETKEKCYYCEVEIEPEQNDSPVMCVCWDCYSPGNRKLDFDMMMDRDDDIS